MKILCETQIFNRETHRNQMPRMMKATLAVGFQHKTNDGNGNGTKLLEIIHFTSQNKMGTRYKVRDNVEKVFIKFLKDGKATISFKQPAENLMIKCDPLQLKGFMQTLKLGLEGKDSLNLRMNIAAATAIPPKSQPQTKLTITQRSDYPTKGFPRSLQQLTITGIHLCKITFQICSLRNLTVLNLSYNKIEKIPNELGRLPLTTLDISHNELGINNLWNWLKGKTLRESLRELDISNNKLNHFPASLIKLEKLVTLKLNNNTIERLPFGIRRLQNLRFLHLSTNHLRSLPSTFNSARFEMLDVWGNLFQERKDHDWDKKPITQTTFHTPTPLWQLACSAVYRYKLPFTAATLPWVLEDILLESPICACGQLCYYDTVYERATLATFENVKNLVFSRDRLIYADIVLCGLNCLGRKQVLAF